MIQKQIGLSIYKCFECNSLLVVPASEIPNSCSKCGTPANIELSQQQREHMERIREGRQGNVHFMQF